MTSPTAERSPTPPASGMQQRLRGGSIWVMGARAVGMGLVFLLHMVLAHLLDPADFAAVVVASSLIAVGSAAAAMGMPILVCRYVAQKLAVLDSAGTRRALLLTTKIAAVSSLIAGLGFWLASDYLGRDVLNTPLLAQSAGWVALWLVGAGLMLFVSEAFRGLHDMRAASLLGGLSGGVVANTVLFIAVVIAANVWKLSFASVAAIWACSFLPVLIASAVYLAKRSLPAAIQSASDNATDGDTDTRPTVSDTSDSHLTVAALLLEALPIVVLQLVSLAMDQVDIWILSAWETEDNVAIYGAVRRLSLVAFIPLTQAGLAIASTVSELHSQQNKEQLARVLRGAATLSLLASVLLSIPLVFFAGPVMSICFGSIYAAGGAALVVISLSQLIKTWLGPCFIALLMTGNQRISLICHLVAAPILLAGPWAMQHSGLLGMAAVVSAMQIVANLLQWLAVRRAVGVWSHASFSPRYSMQLIASGFNLRPRHAPKPLPNMEAGAGNGETNTPNSLQTEFTT